MSLKMFRAVVCVLGLVISSHGGVVNFIKPCKQDDKACLLSSAQAAIPFIAEGLPDFGMPSVDPLVLSDISTGDKDIKINFKHLTVVGPKDCKFTSIELTSLSNIKFDVECPIKATGQYTIDGKLIGAPIQGDGDVTVQTDKIKLSVDADFETVDGSDGKKHWHITSVRKSYDPIEQVHFDFTNLFNGDEAKAGPIRTILNHSWKEVINGIGKPVIIDIIVKVEGIIEKFFAAVPADELYLS